MEKKALDYILVPLGLLAMVAYHLWLLYRIMNYPNKTVIGINTVHRRFWVRAMMESVRYYSHASFLITIVPHKHHKAYVAKTVIKGSYFWSLGLRAFYFSFPLFLWIFGPIPMCLSCFVLTVIKGSYFWSLGLRAFYFSFPLFLWIFGPIPMCLSCFVLVILLYFLDFTFDDHYIDEANFKHYRN
ncbi:hypothetical protein CFP56_020338 [Quercus suber]|uniref:Uncharacterized protein n=1 Tax=Quercus suber TaxID=58331 RepID=A0AAW0KFZ1_QUESU